MIKGIIFDLDGTLVRLPIRYDLLQAELKKMFDATEDFVPLISGIVKKAQGDSSKIQEAFEIICKEESAAAENISVIEGAEDILRHFHSMNLPLGLVTMQCKTAAKKVLEKIHATDIFSFIITRDESHDRLDQIKMALEKLGLEPEHTVMVGDRIHDVESAKKAGCIPVLVKEKLDKKIDCKVFEKISDIKNLV